jgi:membrane-associated phospholipid phosphatase
VEFGGDAVFSPVWWISDQCQGNCSFVSGEGAASFWLVALAFIVPPRWRPPAVALTLVFAALVSATRIAMGGHFLSDVLIAWLLMFLVMVLLDGAILKGLPAAFDAGVDRGLGQAGWAIQRALRLRRSPPPL